LIALAAFAAIAAGEIYRRRRAYNRSWKGDASKALEALNLQLAAGSAQEVAGALSVLLRRVAIRSFSRQECAGLRGREWLRWLSAKDPAGFDWANRGRLLIEAPYAPPGRNVSRGALKILIDAAKKWVR
jgi:hypothetical protein